MTADELMAKASELAARAQRMKEAEGLREQARELLARADKLDASEAAAPATSPGFIGATPVAAMHWDGTKFVLAQ